MKQVFQHLDDGTTEVVEVPCPEVQPGCLLIRSHRTLLSSGTERMLVDFGKASLLGKARRQPEKVKMVLDKVRTNGIAETVEAVQRKLNEAIPLGYSNVGTVLETGTGVRDFHAGDRFVSNGSHAEVVNVPANLCAYVPETVTDDEAAFTVLAAIGLQGVRLARPTLGEGVAVSGIGLTRTLRAQPPSARSGAFGRRSRLCSSRAARCQARAARPRTPAVSDARADRRRYDFVFPAQGHPGRDPGPASVSTLS